MRVVEGHGGFTVEIRNDSEIILNDPRICEALEAAVKDAGAIALWYDRRHDRFRAAELYRTLSNVPPKRDVKPPICADPTIQDTLDYNTATFGQGRTLTEALRYLLGYFWVKTEDQS